MRDGPSALQRTAAPRLPCTIATGTGSPRVSSPRATTTAPPTIARIAAPKASPAPIQGADPIVRRASKRAAISARPAFTAATRNETPYTPVTAAICTSGVKPACE